MSGLNGAGLTLKAALATHHWRREQRAAAATMTTKNDNEREVDDGGTTAVDGGVATGGADGSGAGSKGSTAAPTDEGTPQGHAAGITSQHDGSDLDHIRTAILALQIYAEGETDDQELAIVHSCILNLQKILASDAKNRDAAMGVTPALKHVRRVSRGAGN